MGIIGSIDKDMVKSPEASVPTTSFEAGHGCISNWCGRGFGFFIETKEESTNVRRQVMLRAQTRRNAVNVHPVQPKELAGAEPLEPEKGIGKASHSPVILGVMVEGTVEIVVKVGIKGQNMMGPKSPAGYSIGANATFETFGELPKGGVVVEAHILVIEFLQPVIKGIIPRLVNEDVDCLGPSGSTVELMGGTIGHVAGASVCSWMEGEGFLGPRRKQWTGGRGVG